MANLRASNALKVAPPDLTTNEMQNVVPHAYQAQELVEEEEESVDELLRAFARGKHFKHFWDVGAVSMNS